MSLTAAPRVPSTTTLMGDLEPESPLSDSGGHGLNSKSRNARAQARHRAKRKAYIEQLEASVVTLTDTLNDLKQKTAEDPSGLRYMAMEAEANQLRQENAQLRQEAARLREQLGDTMRSSPSSQRQTPPAAASDDYGMGRDSKRRRRSSDDPYLMAPQAPGATRGVDARAGTSVANQMAAVAQISHQSRFDTQRAQQQRVPMSGVPSELPLPQISTFDQSESSYPRYLPPNMNMAVGSALPPFPSQKSAESAYSSNYTDQSMQQGVQSYEINNGGPSLSQQRSANQSASNQSTNWQPMYGMQQASENQQQGQMLPSIQLQYPLPSTPHHVRAPVFHVAAM